MDAIKEISEAKYDSDRERVMLEKIEHDPDITQASMAAQLGVAVGTVNWHIQRMIKKGYVKVKRAQRRKLRYIITPEGLAFRARLTVQYVENSMRLYRRVRQRASEHLIQLRKAGYTQVQIHGDGDIADICRLSCLEHDITIIDSSEQAADPNTPVLEIHGAKISLRMEHDHDK
jgi:DNA-binding MarR family transcriptional regulator